MSHLELIALFLATSNTNSYTPTFPGALVAWLVCNGRKKHQIGGWLLFYYWQLYSGAFMTVLFFVMGFQSYVPESFDDATEYRLFLLSTVPVLILFVLQLAVATILVSVRTWDLLKLLRWIMLAELAAATVATIIDVTYFPDSLAFDFLTIVPAALWLGYFFRSRRVVHVFKSQDWDTAVNVFYPPKPLPAT
ncbi:MAG: hypothetical protein M1453_05105 [Acidobacteria bacterium]|nr:hypothetical protein [Acidobacteriota bacterium]